MWQSPHLDEQYVYLSVDWIDFDERSIPNIQQKNNIDQTKRRISLDGGAVYI